MSLIPDPLTLPFVSNTFDSSNVTLLIEIIRHILHTKQADPEIVNYLGLDHGTRGLCPESLNYPKLFQDANSTMIDLVRIIRSRPSWIRIDSAELHFMEAVATSPLRQYEQQIMSCGQFHTLPSNALSNLLFGFILELTFNPKNNPTDHPNLWLLGNPSPDPNTIELLDLFSPSNLSIMGFVSISDYFYWIKNVIVQRFSEIALSTNNLSLFKTIFSPSQSPIAFAPSMSHPKVEMIKRETHPVYSHFTRRGWIEHQSFTKILYKMFSHDEIIHKLHQINLILTIQNDVIASNGPQLERIQVTLFNQENQSNQLFNNLESILPMIVQPPGPIDSYLDLLNPKEPQVVEIDNNGNEKKFSNTNLFFTNPPTTFKEHQELQSRVRKSLYHYISLSIHSYELFVYLFKTFGIVMYTPVTLSLMFTTLNLHITTTLNHLNQLALLEIRLRKTYSLPSIQSLDSFQKWHNYDETQTDLMPLTSQFPTTAQFDLRIAPILADTTTYLSQTLSLTGTDLLSGVENSTVLFDPLRSFLLQDLFKTHAKLTQNNIFSYSPQDRKAAYDEFCSTFQPVDQDDNADTTTNTVGGIPLNLNRSQLINSAPLNDQTSKQLTHPYSYDEWYGGINFKDEAFSCDTFINELMKDWVYSDCNSNFTVIKALLMMAHHNEKVAQRQTYSRIVPRYVDVFTPESAEQHNNALQAVTEFKKKLKDEELEKKRKMESDKTPNEPNIGSNSNTVEGWNDNGRNDNSATMKDLASVPDQPADEDDNDDSPTTPGDNTLAVIDPRIDRSASDSDYDDLPSLEFDEEHHNYSQLFGFSPAKLSANNNDITNPTNETDLDQIDTTITTTTSATSTDNITPNSATTAGPTSTTPQPKPKRFSAVSKREVRHPLRRVRESAMVGALERPHDPSKLRGSQDGADDFVDSRPFESWIVAIDVGDVYGSSTSHVDEDVGESSKPHVEGLQQTLPPPRPPKLPKLLPVKTTHMNTVLATLRCYAWFFNGISRQYATIERPKQQLSSTPTNSTSPTSSSTPRQYFSTITLTSLIKPASFAQPVQLYNWLAIKSKSSSTNVEHLQWILSQDLTIVAVLCGYVPSPQTSTLSMTTQLSVLDSNPESSNGQTADEKEPKASEDGSENQDNGQVVDGNNDKPAKVMQTQINKFGIVHQFYIEPIQHTMKSIQGVMTAVLTSHVVPLGLTQPLYNTLNTFYSTLTVLLPPPLKEEKESTSTSTITPTQPSKSRLVPPLSHRIVHPYPLLIPLQTSIAFFASKLAVFTSNPQLVLMYPSLFTTCIIKILRTWNEINAIPELFVSPPGPKVLSYMKNPSLEIKPKAILERDLSILFDSLVWISPHHSYIQPNVSVREDKVGVMVNTLFSDRIALNFSSSMNQIDQILNVCLLTAFFLNFLTPSVARLMEKSISRAFITFKEKQTNEAKDMQTNKDSTAAAAAAAGGGVGDDSGKRDPYQKVMTPQGVSIPLMRQFYDKNTQTSQNEFLSMLYDTVSANIIEAGQRDANQNDPNHALKIPSLKQLLMKWRDYRFNLVPLTPHKVIIDRLVANKSGAQRTGGGVVSSLQRKANLTLNIHKNALGKIDPQNINQTSHTTPTTYTWLSIAKIAIPVFSLVGALYLWGTAQTNKGDDDDE